MSSLGGQVPRVIDLSVAPGSGEGWFAPTWKLYLWSVLEICLLASDWQRSERLKVGLLRRFGAELGPRVRIGRRVRVRAPWRLSLGENVVLSDGVFIRNRERVVIRSNVHVGEGALILTGTHEIRTDMGLRLRPVTIGACAVLGPMCIVMPGATIPPYAVVAPGDVVR